LLLLEVADSFCGRPCPLRAVGLKQALPVTLEEAEL